MIIVTGHSQKLDGICFVARTDDCSEALRLLRDKWNSTYDDQVKLLKREEGGLVTAHYLVWAEVADDVEFGDDPPRREGFVLEARQFDTAKIGDVYVSPVLERMPW